MFTTHEASAKPHTMLSPLSYIQSERRIQVFLFGPAVDVVLRSQRWRQLLVRPRCRARSAERRASPASVPSHGGSGPIAAALASHSGRLGVSIEELPRSDKANF